MGFPALIRLALNRFWPVYFLSLALYILSPANAQESSSPSGTIRERLAAAKTLMSEREAKYAEALKAFDAILQDFPRDPLTSEALFQKGLVLQIQGKSRLAAGIFKQGLKSYPEQARKWIFNLAYMQGMSRQFPECYATYERILKEYPKDPELPIAYYQMGLFKMDQFRLFDAIEQYLKVMDRLKLNGLGQTSAKEISACLQMLDLPLEQAQWDRYIANQMKGESPLNLDRIRKKSWPVHRHSPEYLARVEAALNSGPDLFAEKWMKDPEKISYESMKDLFEPLQLVDAAFHYYPLLLSMEGGKQKARLAGNGNQIGVGLRPERREKFWDLPDMAVHFYVGPHQERFGDEDLRRKGPLPHKGYLPIYTTRYTSEGKEYVQTVTAEGSNPLTVYGTIRIPRGGKVSVLVHHQTGTVKEGPGQILDQQERILCAFSGGRIRIDPDYDQFAWIEAGSDKDSETVFFAIPYEPVTQLQAPSPAEFDQLVQRVSAYWDGVLGRGVSIQVPEEVVMNAWRSTLISNFSMIRDNAMFYSFGNYYQTFYTYEATEAMRAFAFYGYPSLALRLEEKCLPWWNAEFHRAAQIRAAHDLTLLSGDTEFIRNHETMLKKYTDELNNARKSNPKGLQPKGVYSGDIGQIQVYGLDHNLGAYSAILDFGWMMKAIGKTELGETYLRAAQEYRPVIIKAIEDSMFQDFDPPFIPQALFGDEKPYEHIQQDIVGSYYNLSLSRVQDTGVFGPKNPMMTVLNRYIEQRGGRIAGLLRFSHHMSPYVGKGIDDTYQIPYNKSLLWRDEIDRFLVTFYGKLATGMTHETFVGAEVNQVAPEEGEQGRRMYLPPNSTTNAHFLQNLRHMLVFEEDEDVDGKYDRLYFLKATPRSWLAAGKKISMAKMPTFFGNVSAEIEVSPDSKTIQANLDLPSRDAPKEVILRLRRPKGLLLHEVVVNGTSFQKFDPVKEEIDLSSFSSKMSLIAKYQ